MTRISIGGTVPLLGLHMHNYIEEQSKHRSGKDNNTKSKETNRPSQFVAARRKEGELSKVKPPALKTRLWEMPYEILTRQGETVKVYSNVDIHFTHACEELTGKLIPVGSFIYMRNLCSLNTAVLCEVYTNAKGVKGINVPKIFGSRLKFKPLKSDTKYLVTFKYIEDHINSEFLGREVAKASSKTNSIPKPNPVSMPVIKQTQKFMTEPGPLGRPQEVKLPPLEIGSSNKMPTNNLVTHIYEEPKLLNISSEELKAGANIQVKCKGSNQYLVGKVAIHYTHTDRNIYLLLGDNKLVKLSKEDVIYLIATELKPSNLDHLDSGTYFILYEDYVNKTPNPTTYLLQIEPSGKHSIVINISRGTLDTYREFCNSKNTDRSLLVVPVRFHELSVKPI